MSYSILKYFAYDILREEDKSSIVYYYMEDIDVKRELDEYNTQVIVSELTQQQAKSIVDELNGDKR